MKGSIVRVQDKGFGFIKPEEGDNDVFFHASALVDIDFDELKEGDMVTYDVEEGPKGPSATNVRRADDSDDSAQAADDTEETPAEASEEAPAEEAEETQAE